MFRSVTNLFHKKKSFIEGEIGLKNKVDNILPKLIREEILEGSNLTPKLSYTISRGIIKIETENKVIAQEIALKIRRLERRLKDEGVDFVKLLV